VILILASVINSLSQVIMRGGGRHSESLPNRTWQEWLYGSRWWLIGLFISWFSGLVWAWSVRTIPLSVAIPVYTGLIYVFSVIMSAMFLQEGLRANQLAGAIVIFIGMLMILLPQRA
jgi:multidrug transporter EmrE-like cation transporter